MSEILFIITALKIVFMKTIYQYPLYRNALQRLFSLSSDSQFPYFYCFLWVHLLQRIFSCFAGVLLILYVTICLKWKDHITPFQKYHHISQICFVILSVREHMFFPIPHLISLTHFIMKIFCGSISFLVCLS